MECTQRLDCTEQELFTQRECPEQIGFLGICGNRYPVKKGPNKIGRDPQTCNIVLNLNSVSRQHAVLNVLHKNEYMLMDLDSANKTKLLGKTLMPYMPLPLKNGDTVQFGEIFGVFRLLEEEYDLPMTQAMNIPDTPVPTRHMPNFAKTIPESPDVSDKDDSFIISSQLKGRQFKTSNTHFIKPGKTISIQPIGGNKIDNVYWNSSKKSSSLNSDDSTCSLNDSKPFVRLSEKENEANASNIHEMVTQAPPASIYEANTQAFPPLDSIYEANTQLPESSNPSSINSANTHLPGFSTSSQSIYTANTQLPASSKVCPSIHTANTQIPDEFHSSEHCLDTQPPLCDNLPDVCKINEQQDMQFDLCADKDSSIYNADTQMFPESPIRVNSNSGSPSSRKSILDKSKLNRSDDVVFFDDIDSQPEYESLESQALLAENSLLPVDKRVETESEPLSQIALPKSSKRNMRIESDSSTDCEEIDDDILLSQKIPEKDRKVNDGDATDCEDEMMELKPDEKSTNTAEALEAVATQVIDVVETAPTHNGNFEDMLTQIINIDEKIEVDKDDSNEKLEVDKDDSKNIDFEDLPTQVLVESKQPVKAQPISDEIEISPFKIPLKSAFKAKKKITSITPKIKAFVNVEIKTPVHTEDDKYYQDTQDIFDDLCSQIEPEEPNLHKKPTRDTLMENEASSQSNKSDTFLKSDVEEKINNFVSTLSTQDVRDVIGVDTKVAPVKKLASLGSDASDVELTPKKIKPIKFMDINLPNSQEIKTSVSLSSKAEVTESSSESETEQNSDDVCTPILFHKKKKPKHDAKINLTKRFDVETLPTRVITRVRKPTSKVRDGEGKKLTESILKPNFLTEKDDVDIEIITENIKRFKSKNEKSKNKCNAKDTSKVTKLNTTKSLDETKKSDDKKQIKEESSSGIVQKDSKPQIKTENKITESKPKLEETKDRESKRKSKSSLPVEESSQNVVVNVLLENPDKSYDPAKSVKNVDLCKDIDKTKTRELKRYTSAPKTEEERPRGPIMIEPHTLTIPIKEEKKKREYKRKNKEPPAKTVNKLENHDFSIETKSNNSIKVENVETIESKRPVRSTRGRKKILDDFIETTETQAEEKPTRTKKGSKEPSPEIEVRRSKRQRTVKEKEEPVKVPVVKSILKKMTVHEQSTVYNLSSGSNCDSPKNLKRSADEFEASFPKRTRSMVANTNLRATPSSTQKTCYVLFTAFPYEEVKMKLEKLGAVVVTDVMQCTVLLTLQIKRTFKLLCAVGLGKPIVGSDWVQACADNNMIVDPWLYTIKDETAEKRFDFSLERTLRGKRNFLQGYNVSSTPRVMPQASEMKLIVQCSGGTWQEGGPRWVCITCVADRALWAALRRRGATLLTTEFILGGVLQQRLNIDATKVKMQ